MQWILFFYYLIANFAGIAVMFRDKIAKVNHRKRVPDNILMQLGILSGGIGMFVTMLITRHRLDERKFMIGLPVIFVAELIAIIMIMKMSGII